MKTKKQLRNYLVFEANFPTEGGWIGDEPDHDNPPGRQIAEYLLSVVSPDAPLSEIWNEEGYGWEFLTKREGLTVSVLAQRVEQWLVIVHVVSLKPGFMRGAKYDKVVEGVCEAIVSSAERDGRFEPIRRLTCAEFEAATIAQARSRSGGP